MAKSTAQAASSARKAPALPQARRSWPKEADRAAAEANCAKAKRLKQPSYVVPYKLDGGALKEKVMWLAAGKIPIIMGRGVKLVDGARVLQRPSKLADASGTRDVRELPELQPEGFDGNTDGWEDEEDMPHEPNE